MFASDIHLNLYSDKANLLMRVLYYALRDSTAMPRHTRARMTVVRDLNKETYITIDSSYTWEYNLSKWARFANEHDAKDWLANYLKRWLFSIKHYSLTSWGRLNDLPVFKSNDSVFKLSSFKDDANALANLTWQDFYYFYDFLKERKRALKMYPQRLIDEFKGEELDPISVEIERTRLAEIDRLEEEMNAALRKNSAACSDEIEKASDAINAKYNALNEQIKAEYQKKIDEVKSAGKDLDILAMLAAS